MKPRLFLATAIVMVASCVCSYAQAPASPNDPFLGRWDLTLKTAGHEFPSWIELRQQNGHLTAQMVGRWGNARPLPKIEITQGKELFVSPKDEVGSKSDIDVRRGLTL